MKHFWMGANKGLNRMVGQVFDRVEANGEELVFENETEKYVFYHEQGCCESVQIEDICGDLHDLVGSPLMMAAEVDNEPEPGFGADEWQPESYTWTFYKFATTKGYVTVRWLGTSNGYYSESVDIKLIDKKNDRKIRLDWE